MIRKIELVINIMLYFRNLAILRKKREERKRKARKIRRRKRRGRRKRRKSLKRASPRNATILTKSQR